MIFDRRAMTVSSGLAGVAVLAELARYLAEQSGLQIMAYQNVYSVVVPLLLAAVGAFYVTTADEASVDSVVAGFVLGGLLYGGSLLLFHWFVNYQSIGSVLHILPFHAVLTATFVVMASLGALGGNFVGPFFRNRRSSVP